jgi:enoyl-CoA hydratase
MQIEIETSNRITIVTINRPERRNAVDIPAAQALFDAFAAFNTDDTADVAILTGAGGHFCAGADLQAIAAGEQREMTEDGALAPMGPSRMKLGKPVIAAIEGYAVAGGLELAAWCDLRVAGQSATLGVFCRRFGVPLIDLGTIRLPRLIGQSRAADMILTGRAVGAPEALSWGLVNRVVPDGQALAEAIILAEALTRFPQAALRGDRLSMLEQWGMQTDAAIANEMRHGLRALSQGVEGAGRFTAGSGRHGAQT